MPCRPCSTRPYRDRGQYTLSLNPKTTRLVPSDSPAENAVTHLVYKIGQHAFRMVNIQRRSLISVRTDPQRCSELGNRDTGSANGRLAFFGLVEAARDEDLAEQAAQCDIPSPFESEVDASLDELVLSGHHGCVEAYKVALLDAVAERTEQGFQTGKRDEEILARESVCVDKVAGDEVCED